MNSRYHDRFFNRKVSFSVKWIILLSYFLLSSVNPSHGEEPFFSIALSKFNSEHDASREESRLKNSGHNAFYRKEKNPSGEGTVYQVYIEKYNSRDEAEKEAIVLKDLELISDYKVREVRETPQTVPEKTAPSEAKETESPPVIQANDGKDQEPGTGPLSESQTTERESSILVNEPVAATIPYENKTNPETEPPAKADMTKSEVNANPAEKKTVQNSAPEPQPEPKTGIETEPVTKVDREVEAETKTSKPKPVIDHDDDGLTGWSLQVGAFSEEANAADLKITLTNLGRHAFYRYESADGMGMFYRLYITGYSSLGEAIKDAKKLVESGVISSYSRVHSREPLSDIPSEPVKKEGKTYFIHVGDNKDEANAAENVAKLKEQGYKAIYILEKDTYDSWYRVYVGEFKDEDEARKKGMELLEKGLISYFKPVEIDSNKLGN